MIICVDFDGTVVKDDHAYDDLQTPLELLDGCLDALHALKRAGHLLVLWSGRASARLRIDPRLDPLVRAGVVRVDPARFEERKKLNEARYQQMLDFVRESMPGVWDAIDDGWGGKPGADLFIDDRTIDGTPNWPFIAARYGEPLPADDGE